MAAIRKSILRVGTVRVGTVGVRTESGRSPLRLLVPLILGVLLGGAAHAAEESIAEILEEENADLVQIEAQINAGETNITRAWLESRIDDIQDQTHRYDSRLVRPMTLLGDIHAKEGRFDQALEDYGQAIHIQRVSDGLVSPGQVEIVHREADTHRQMGNMKEANEREEYAYHILRRAYAPYDIATLPGVFRLATWYQQTNNVFSARALYQRSFDILNANGKGNSLEAIPALEGLADSYKFERFPPFYLGGGDNAIYGASLASSSRFGVPISVNSFPAGERALQRIIQIYRDNGNDPVIVAQAVLELADWNLLFDKMRRATPLYKYAYDLLDAEADVDAGAYFAEPRILHYPRPEDPQTSPAGSGARQSVGYVEVSYLITPSGYIRGLKTVSSQPKGMMDFRVRKSIRAARFRPMLVDGVPVKADMQSFRHEFAYSPTSEETETDVSSTRTVESVQ